MHAHHDNAGPSDLQQTDTATRSQPALHVDARVEYLKNGTRLMTHSPNARPVESESEDKNQVGLDDRERVGLINDNQVGLDNIQHVGTKVHDIVPTARPSPEPPPCMYTSVPTTRNSSQSPQPDKCATGTTDTACCDWDALCL